MSLERNNYDAVTDDELMTRYQQGDTWALGVLYERYAAPILGYCYRLMGDIDAAREIRNDAFVRIMQRQLLFKTSTTSSFGGWVRTIAHHLCLNQLASPALKRRAPLDECAEPVAPAMSRELDFDRSWLEQAIDQLPDVQRVCIRLRYFEERSPSEIVNETGLTANTVRSALQNGKLRLKQLAEKHRSNAGTL